MQKILLNSYHNLHRLPGLLYASARGRRRRLPPGRRPPTNEHLHCVPGRFRFHRRPAQMTDPGLRKRAVAHSISDRPGRSLIQEAGGHSFNKRPAASGHSSNQRPAPGGHSFNSISDSIRTMFDRAGVVSRRNAVESSHAGTPSSRLTPERRKSFRRKSAAAGPWRE